MAGDRKKELQRELTKQDRETIVDFLNEVHAPFNKKKWQVDERNKVFYVGPSITYMRKQGGQVKKSMFEDFTDEAKKSGFDDEFIKRFIEKLVIESHQFRSFYELQDTDFLREILLLAEKWKLGKSSKLGVFGKSEAVAEIDISKLKTDIDSEIKRITETEKKEAKSELSAEDFSNIIPILTKIQSGQQEKITSDDKKIFDDFKQKLEKNGAASKIIDQLNQLDNFFQRLDSRFDKK